MAETLISPGVFLQENDLSQILEGPITVGAALIGPAVLGPVNIPTLVRSYSDYKSKFGTSFVSGGTNYEYLTSIAALNYFEQGGESLIVTRIASGSFTPATASILNTLSTSSFTLETISSGIIMNNDSGSTLGVSGSLPSGSENNIRWEITTSSTGSGVFSLIVRRGDDYSNQKTILESWSNLSLDPNQNNYIEYVIGNQDETPVQDESGAYYLQTTGSYVNRSRYIRVKSVTTPTPNYFTSLGQPQSAYTGFLPAVGSGSLQGSFGGAVGTLLSGSAINLFENIPAVSSDPSTLSTNIQGVFGSNYTIAVSLLANKDSYNYKTIYAPGLNNQNASSVLASILSNTQERGDAIAVVDMVSYNQVISTVVGQAQSIDSSYGATYWPWVQLRSRETGKLVFAPASTIVPAAYEYNDKVSAEWFAPAGLTRGGLSTVIQPERRLTVSQRDSLYSGKVNPIAIFPGQGTVIYGQKTLQAKPSALDRVNVRRLLITLKRYIGNIAEGLVFEQNSQTTRNNFLNRVNPYLQLVQQRQGLYAYRVVMDDTNNTPDVIDRNQLVGSIYLQPTKTAEYILLDFNILPTGTTFGQ
jgi:phage tail sheath protein FI